MKTLKEKSEIRFGLWQAYKKKCAVCSEPIKYIQLQIDHIIPESIERDAMELKKVLSIFSLNKDFEINSLYNLRPACGFCNREKSYYIAPEEITAKLLRKASTKKRDVEREAKRFLEEFKYALKVESMRNAVSTGNIVLEEYVDQVNEYVANYGEEYVRIENDLTNFCSINQFTVKMDGHLPTINEPKGNCIFTFNSFYIRGTVVSLSHEEILQTLYKGFETPVEIHLRPYIIAKIDEDTYIIQIGSCRFNLNQLEVKHLCVVVDKFIKEYIQAVEKIEKALLCRDYYPLKNDIQKYKIVQIGTGLWHLMLRFAKEHDYEAGNSSWHIFDSSGRNMIKVYTNEISDKYNSGFHCFVHSIADSEYSWTPANHVWLVWWNVEQKNNFSIRDSWSVNQTYKWFVNEFIPKVLYTYNKPTSKGIFGFKKTIPFEQYKENNDFKDYYYRGSNRLYNVNKVTNVETLLELITDLQHHYSEDFYCREDMIHNCYDALLLILNFNTTTDFHYLCSKLDLEHTTNIDDLITQITYQKIKERHVSKRNLDMIFRVMYAVIDSSKNVLNEDELLKVFNYLEPLVILYNRDKLVEAYNGK
jgi:hypothetical protein